MAYLDHREANDNFRERVMAGIANNFPLEGRVQSLHLEGLEIREKEGGRPDDIRAQHKAKVEGKTLATPIYAKLVLRNNETGKVVKRQKVMLAEVPTVTQRYSHIIDGKEYQVDNQWQLKPGVYTRRDQQGRLRSQFNVTGKSAFKIDFDPKTKQFNMLRGSSDAKIPLYPLMKAMGANDDALKKQWGGEVLEANKTARGVNTALEKFYRTDRRKKAASTQEATRYLLETMQGSQLRPDSTKLTIGKEFNHVNIEVLQLAAEKLLKVQAGAAPDDRDSLEFKDLRTVGDYAYDKLTSWDTKKSLRRIAGRRINTTNNIREIVKKGTFQRAIRDVFSSAAARTADQINPVEMLSSSLQTTLLGPGGIKSEQMIVDEAKYINPSHFGFLDPLHTPESSKTGVTLRLPMGVRKIGKEPRIPLHNMRTGKVDYVGPSTFRKSKVVLADQVTWINGKPKPIATKVKFSDKNNEFKEGSFHNADYVMKHPSQMLNVTTNLIPFLGSNSGVRVRAATSHIEQAISLREREAPLVQTSTGSEGKGLRTFDELMGRQAGHRAPISGEVVKVKRDGIHIRDQSGKVHEVQLYNNFPLNDPKSVLDSTPTVKVGDRVKKNDNVADTNFTRNGTLALGRNLFVGYLPYKGYNFEDGVVISKSAAEKLASIHMRKEVLKIEDNAITKPMEFEALHAGSFSPEQYKKLDATGVVRVGQEVFSGDPLVLSTTPYKLGSRFDIRAMRKSAMGHHVDQTRRWGADVKGTVVAVHRKGSDVTVHIKTIEPMRVGDKIAGRYGNKGIISKIEDDKNMPHTRSGQILEVALNPSGVPGRMNIGQVLETAASKIAEKTGKTYIVNNFAPGVDQLAKVKADLKKHKLSDTEELIDPMTGISLGQTLVGKQHMLKLTHQIDKKTSVRSGLVLPESEPEVYDLNLMPSQGGKAGGMSIGALGLYTLLAHGAKANIREMQTWKSEGPADQERWPTQHRDVWGAIQGGTMLPTPKPTYSYRKFENLLRGAGINIEKKGHNIQLSPLTNGQILKMSKGELKSDKASESPVLSKLDKSGAPIPEKGGLFDPYKTGGHGGKNWTHIKLAEPIPNPIFEGPIQKLTGISKKDYHAVVSGSKSLNRAGRIVEVGSPGSTTGGPAIVGLLGKINVDRDLPKAEFELQSVKMPSTFRAGGNTTKLDKALKKVKYLRALKEMGMKPTEAYVLQNLPILPPAMRPLSILPNGNVQYEDINGLYRKFAEVNDKLGKPIVRDLGDTDPDVMKARSDMYDGVRAIIGIGSPAQGDSPDKEIRGILHQIKGVQPKKGYFQKTLMNRRQDLTMRSVIVPEPSLGIDEVGLPRKKAMTLFRPFVVGKLVEIGAAGTPLEAQKLVDEKRTVADRALEMVALERPILLKRDPTLHKHSIQAFRPRLVDGHAIQIHPLVTGGYNADFDGDTMSVYVPISPEAVEEAKKMYPSKNLFNEASGRVTYQPTLESALGLYKLSRITQTPGKPTLFKNPAAVLEAARKKRIDITELVRVGNTPVGRTNTTAGRLLLAAALPSAMQGDILTKHDELLDKKGVNKIFTILAKSYSGEFGDVANRLKDLGDGMSFGVVQIPNPSHVGPNAIAAAENPKKTKLFIPTGTHTLSLNDFEPDRKMRDQVLGRAQRAVDMINSHPRMKDGEKKSLVNSVWGDASIEMRVKHIAKAQKNPSNLFLMQQADVKPGWSQYKQLVLAPVQVTDAANRIVPLPIKRSYAEGFDMAEYWTQAHGARGGTLQKVQEVSEPGLFSKQLINTAMSLVVDKDDCETPRGISLNISSDDVYDRELAKPLRIKGHTFNRGTILRPDVVDRIRAGDKNAKPIVRSSLKCEHGTGLCQKCAGIGSDGEYYSLGTNLGIISAQSLGERAVQLTMKAFHKGGVATQGGAKMLNDFSRVKQLTMLPATIPNSAMLAMRSGRIDKIEKDPTGVNIFIGGESHHVAKDRDGLGLHQYVPGLSDPTPGAWKPPKVGMRWEAGDTLSDPTRTVVNPRDLYKATGKMDVVQNHLVTELHNIYKQQGVRRQHVETTVKAMSNLTRVRDPGDANYILRGEFRAQSQLRALNSELVKAGKRPVEHEPILKGIDVIPLEIQEDWMAKLMHNKALRSTIMDAAVEGAITNLHGLHPVPGMAYGAEFGLTKRHALTPGLKHLADVPEHGY